MSAEPKRRYGTTTAASHLEGNRVVNMVVLSTRTGGAYRRWLRRLYGPRFEYHGMSTYSKWITGFLPLRFKARSLFVGFGLCPLALLLALVLFCEFYGIFFVEAQSSPGANTGIDGSVDDLYEDVSKMFRRRVNAT